MRATTSFVIAALAACHPSASIENTMPVANLQTYRTVALHVQGTAFASQGYALSLEQQVLDRLHKACGFESVGRATGAPADVLLDLNITKMARGGGFISNPNLATMDALMVLSDGQTGELLGSAKIHGESSSVQINNSNPEQEAVEVVAKTVGDTLGKSGCSGPRVAKATPPPPPPGDGSGSGSGSDVTPPPTDSTAKAEALNDSGKQKFRTADLDGALADFNQANTLVADPKYVYNACMAYEAKEQWDKALASCKQAKGMNPKPELLTKIDYRMDLLQKHH